MVLKSPTIAVLGVIYLNSRMLFLKLSVLEFAVYVCKVLMSCRLVSFVSSDYYYIIIRYYVFESKHRTFVSVKLYLMGLVTILPLEFMLYKFQHFK